MPVRSSAVCCILNSSDNRMNADKAAHLLVLKCLPFPRSFAFPARYKSVIKFDRCDISFVLPYAFAAFKLLQVD